jgi:hypothetical protein
VEVVCDGGKLIRRQCIPATGDSGLVFEERGAGTYVAVQETSDAAPGRRGYLEYIATINGDQWTQRAKSHLDTYPNPAAHRLPWAEKTYRRVAIQGRCGASTGRECMYQLCPMCPEPDDPLWVMAGGGRGCKQCLERIWAGNPPPIFECRRAKRIGRAVPIGTPGAVRVPSEAPPPSYPGQPAPSRAPAGASPSGQPENMFMMGVESQPTPSAGR